MHVCGYGVIESPGFLVPVISDYDCLFPIPFDTVTCIFFEFVIHF